MTFFGAWSSLVFIIAWSISRALSHSHVFLAFLSYTGGFLFERYFNCECWVTRRSFYSFSPSTLQCGHYVRSIPWSPSLWVVYLFGVVFLLARDWALFASSHGKFWGSLRFSGLSRAGPYIHWYLCSVPLRVSYLDCLRLPWVELCLSETISTFFWIYFDGLWH